VAIPAKLSAATDAGRNSLSRARQIRTPGLPTNLGFSTPASPKFVGDFRAELCRVPCGSPPAERSWLLVKSNIKVRNISNIGIRPNEEIACKETLQLSLCAEDSATRLIPAIEDAL
jgi:hypothetical protein